MVTTLKERFAKVNRDINAYGFPNARLVAVSKTVSAEIIKEAYDAGQRIFGENRIEVLEAKARQLPLDISWHFIGNLQSRKLKQIIEYAHVIHSVDEVAKILKIDRICGELSKSIEFLIQVNISGEESKSGLDEHQVHEAVEAALCCKNAKCVGLMTMAPFDASEDVLHFIFSKLSQLRHELTNEYKINLPELSMGMSNDYIIALKEGATLIRVGSAIFDNF